MEITSANGAIPMAGGSAIETATVRQILIRFMPLLMGCYLAAYIDRVNVGFAALTANRDLGLSPSQFGWGAGLFFIGYCLAEVPSNLILVKVGARRWFARIMISMGLIAGATAFVTGPQSFYVARFALGAAEAGLLPGIIWFFRSWVPHAYRAQYMAIFLLAIPLSSLVGSPISGAILGLDSWLGLKGWQWLFMLEGAPCVILGVLVLIYLTETPAEAKWLSQEQRDWLQACYDEERRHRLGSIESERPRTWSLINDARVLAYGGAFFGVLAGSYGLSLWLPQMVKAFGVTNFQIGLITAIPFAFGCVATIMLARSSDRTGERVWHVAGPAFIAAVGLGASALVTSPVLTMVAMSFAAIGIFGLRGTFYALVSERFSDANAAPGIALVGSYSSLAGFVGPYAVGLLKDATGTFVTGMIFLALLSCMGGIIVVMRNRYERRSNGAA
jgi:ACS family tartrate transporter-like MFS transporter